MSSIKYPKKGFYPQVIKKTPLKKEDRCTFFFVKINLIGNIFKLFIYKKIPYTFKIVLFC